MEHIYLILWKCVNGSDKYHTESGVIFTEKRLADNYAEAKNTLDPQIRYYPVEGVILPIPETEAEATV